MAFSLGPAPLGLHAPSDRHTGPPLGPSCFTSRITSPRQAPVHRSPSTRTRWPRPASLTIIRLLGPRPGARFAAASSRPLRAGRTCPDSDGQDSPARTPLLRLVGPEWRARNRRSRPALRSRATIAIVVVPPWYPAGGAGEPAAVTSTPPSHHDEDTLDKPLVRPRGPTERSYQSACKWTRTAPAVCIWNGTQRPPYCRPVGGPAGFDSQRQRTLTYDITHVCVIRCHGAYIYHGTHPKVASSTPCCPGRPNSLQHCTSAAATT